MPFSGGVVDRILNSVYLPVDSFNYQGMFTQGVLACCVAYVILAFGSFVSDMTVHNFHVICNTF